MIVIHDYTQLIKISQRRLTATWHERRGTSVDIVPQIAREAATGVVRRQPLDEAESHVMLHSSFSRFTIHSDTRGRASAAQVTPQASGEGAGTMNGTNSALEDNAPTTAARATYQDVLDAPEHVVAEIINGTLYTHPRPAPRHATAASRLGMILGGPFDRGRGGPGGWRILDEPELHLGEDILVPDLAGWRRDRMPQLPDSAYFELTPDWACEVLSASTRKLDLVRKRPIYANEEVPHLWLIDPIERILEAFELHEGQWILIASVQDDDPVSIRPFEAITFSLEELWD